MVISDAITLLKNSELKQFSVKDEPATVLGYINLGILELYKRFVLWESEAVITQAADTSLYTLDGVDANVSIDLSDNELIKIERVYDEDNLLYILNNEKDPDSLETPRFNSLKVVTIVPDYTMTVIYRATPKFHTADTETIPLPPQFFEALFMYTAYKAQTSVKPGERDEANRYYKKFEASCARIAQEGLYIQQDLVSSKFKQRGFV